MMRLVYAFVLAFLTVLVLGPGTIGWLRRLKFGQTVRDDGPKSHLQKTGTPTMGGILILAGILVGTLVVAPAEPLTPWLLGITLGFSIIGLVDDFLIVVFHRSLGLRAREKLLGQFILALAVALYAAGPFRETALFLPGLNTTLTLPGWVYVVFLVFFIVGFSNGTNLTDGLDGLASGTVAIAAAAYAMIAVAHNAMGVAVFMAAVTGACLGFIWFNAPPAQVFMGDTGSLALGAALAMAAIFTRTELLLVIIGGIFVVEALSVILQVISFKLTGKRIFRMSPLHHHFEMGGMPETKVVARFWLVALGLALWGLILAARARGIY